MNYQNLLNIRPKKYKLLFIMLFISILIIIIILQCKIYDVYNTIGYYSSDCLVLNIPITNSDTISNLKKVKINNKEYSYEIESISNILLDENNLINYQEYQIKLNDELISNMTYKVTLYYNKEQVYVKLKNILF
jgi:hypothetical protein